MWVMLVGIINMGQARSSAVEHCFDVARVSGSIPLAPTKVPEKYCTDLYVTRGC